MKQILVVGLSALAAFSMAGCRTQPAIFPSEWQREVRDGQGTVVFVPDDQLAAMPRCRATVLEKWPCFAVLRTTDGVRFMVGAPDATPEVLSFVGTLQEGRTYMFPDAFEEHRKGRALRSTQPLSHAG